MTATGAMNAIQDSGFWSLYGSDFTAMPQRVGKHAKIDISLRAEGIVWAPQINHEFAVFSWAIEPLFPTTTTRLGYKTKVSARCAHNHPSAP